MLVVPAATSEISTLVKASTDPLNQKRSVSVAEIQGVVESSQAESLGLGEGDLVIEYDGVRINNARQLVNWVEKRSSAPIVEMVIARDKIPIRLSLSGGFIGVRVKTKQISKEEAYLPG